MFNGYRIMESIVFNCQSINQSNLVLGNMFSYLFVTDDLFEINPTCTALCEIKNKLNFKHSISLI